MAVVEDKLAFSTLEQSKAVEPVSDLRPSQPTVAPQDVRPVESGDDAAVVQFSKGADPEQTPSTYNARAMLATPKRDKPVLAAEEFTPNIKAFQAYDTKIARDLKNLNAEMLKTDAVVREHEETHKRELGPYAKGGINYQMALGPDGMLYARGGSISVDLEPADTPEATIEKAKTIEKAALAVYNPSKADRQVAAKARELGREARLQLETVA